MYDLKISMKIGIAFGIIFLMFAFLSISMGINFNRMKVISEEIIDVNNVVNEFHELENSIIKGVSGHRGYLVTGKEEYLESYNKALQQVPDRLRALKRMYSNSPDHSFLFAQLETHVNSKLIDIKSTIELAESQGLEAARKRMYSGEGRVICKKMFSTIAEIISLESKVLDKKISEKTEITTYSRRAIVYTGVLALILIILITIYFSKTIAVPLEKASALAGKIARGDLSSEEIVVKRNDEVGLLLKSLMKMSDILQKQIMDIREGIEVLSSSSAEIMSGVAQLASSAAQTATAIGETTTTIEEVKQTADVSSQKAGEVSEDSKRLARITEEGNKSVYETSESMTVIKQKMEMIASVVVNLSEQSHIIGEITATVNELAEQSNILAVNAAIEAAKAGEQGRGFSVVASEIKNLATKSKDATAQVRNILNEIQKSISKVVMATEDGGRTVETGNDLIKAAQEAIDLLSRSVSKAAQASIQIASSSQQQLIGMDQVVVAMENIRDSSSQIATTTQQTSVSVQDLHRLGERLQDLTNFYKVKA